MKNIKNTKYIEKVFEDYISAEKAAGAAAAVYKEGKEIFSCSAGYADREAKTKMTKDTIFRCFSMSKPVTAVALLILVERGIVDLFDPLSKYFPEYSSGMCSYLDNGEIKKYEGEITLYNLMNMTSGLVYPDAVDAAGKKMDEIFAKVDADREAGIKVTTADFARRLSEAVLCMKPGAFWRYGTSADIIGAVVEAASGLKFSEFLEKEIFKPLKMRDTGFFVPDKKKKRFAQIYMTNSEGKLEIGSNKHLAMGGYDKAPDFESGGAGLVSTIEDYSKFAMMLANGGEYEGIRIISEASARFMRTPQLSSEQKKTLDWGTLRGFSYGNFCRVLEDNSCSGLLAPEGAFGWDGWAGCYFIADPVNNMVLIFVIQKHDGTDDVLIRKFINTVYGSL